MRLSMSDVRRSKIVSAPAPCIGSCSRNLVETNDYFKRSAGVTEKPAEGPIVAAVGENAAVRARQAIRRRSDWTRAHISANCSPEPSIR